MCSNRTEDGDTAVTQTINDGETGNAPTLICFVSISVRLFCVVILLLHDSTAIAEGKVVCREVVHGVTLTKDEVAVNVVEVLTNYRVVHPKHGYDIEAGGYTAWPVCKCQPRMFMARSVCCVVSCSVVVYLQDSETT